MQGILEIRQSDIATKLEQAKGLVATLDAVPSQAIEFLVSEGLHRDFAAKLDERVEKLERVNSLAAMFPEVSLDLSCVRKVRTSRDRDGDIEIPLVFSHKVPLPISHQSEHVYGSGRYHVTARCPVPVPEALKAIKEHKTKFDHLEVWWVPNDVLIVKIPDPDPLLVGAAHDGDQFRYFELHRWIDESVEDPWWSGAAY